MEKRAVPKAPIVKEVDEVEVKLELTDSSRDGSNKESVKFVLTPDRSKMKSRITGSDESFLFDGFELSRTDIDRESIASIKSSLYKKDKNNDPLSKT